MNNIYGLTMEEMEEYFISLGSKKFHADQLFSWLYEKRIDSYDSITNIKKELLEEVSKKYSIDKLKIVSIEKDVDVCKYLFELYDGEHIEAVLMKHDYGNSICVSSQVGCNMGCRFCESGRRKRVRNLEAYEMVLQILMIEEELGKRISHVVVMGIGPIGLMAVAGAAHLGAARILAVGSRPLCVKTAYEFGATEVLSYKDGDIVKQVMERTDGIGADSVIICGGNDEVFAQAIDMVRYGIGTVSNVNYFGGTGNLPFPKFSGGRGMAGKTIRTELAEGGRARIERMLSMVKYGRIHPEKLVTHHLKGLDQVEDALYLMRDKPADLIKVMVTME